MQVAVAVAGKLAPELVAREPFAEISALATECFRQLVTTPQIAVHIGADIFETAKEKLEEIARTRGFDGRLLVQSDDDHRRPAIAGSNGPTAASIATAPRRWPPSMTWSAAMSRPAPPR